jgi:hypothetical protein
MKHLVGSTKTDIDVYASLTESAAASKISENPQLLSLAKESLKNSVLSGSHVVFTYNMKRDIGYDFVVEVSDKSDIFYAQTVKNGVYIPFTKRGRPQSTQLLTMILDYDKSDNYYMLSDLWIGSPRPCYPRKDTESCESKDYWDNHAHVFGDQTVKPSSVTHEYPY